MKRESLLTVLLCLTPWIDAREIYMEDDGSSSEWWEERMAEGGINLNQATREELEAIPFLNARQVESLLEYRFDYKRLYSLEELALVPGMDSMAIKGLKAVGFAGEPAEQETWNLEYGKHQLTARLNRSFPSKLGFADSSYLGSSWNGYLKYRFKHRRLTTSFAVEQDEGEPWNTGHGPGFDFHGGHIALHSLKWLETLIVGDYKARFAHGLVWGESASFSRTAQVTSLHGDNTRLKPCYSTAESGFLRGVGISVKQGRWNAQAWASHTHDDPTGGYHRTAAEVEKKHTVHRSAAGAHIGYNALMWNVGIQGAFVPKGMNTDEESANLSADFTCKAGRIYLSGEGAVDRNGHGACIGKIQYFAEEAVSCYMTGRYYGKQYEAAMAGAMKQGTCVRNEAGISMACQCAPWKRATAFFYWDAYKTPGPAYSLTRPGYGYEARGSFSYIGKKDTEYILQYNTYGKDKAYTASPGAKTLWQERKHTVKCQWAWSPCPEWNWKGGCTLLWLSDKERNWNSGTALYLRWKGEWAQGKWAAAGMLALFDTQGYATRIYLYENDVYQTFGSVACYDRGLHLSVLLTAHIGPCTMQLKAGHTCYTDKTSVGSGKSLTEGPRRTGMRLLVKWDF